MFAQLMGEMFTPTTFESFRVYSLDTVARLREAVEVIEDIRRKRLPKVAFEPIAQELQWSLLKDSAAKSLADPEIHSLCRILKGGNHNLDGLSAHVKLIIRLIEPHYKDRLEEKIFAIIDKPNRKTEIRKLTGFYCSHIINLGYSRRHILNLVQETFLLSRVQRVGRPTLGRFFRNFDGKSRRFVVLSAVTKEFGSYLGGVGISVRDVSALSHDETATLSGNINYEDMPSAVELTINALDGYGAMDKSYQLLTGQRAITYLDPYGVKCEWGNKMHVTLSRANSGISIEKIDPIMNKTKPSRSGRRHKYISRYARTLTGNFNVSSTERLLSSIRTAALARTSLDTENTLISLWSAIEVLLSEPEEKPRIVHYSDLICPCITLRHARRQIFAIYDEMLIGHRFKFNKIIKSHPEFPDVQGQTAFAEIALLPEHAQLRDELCKVLSSSPLALHRLWKLNQDYTDMKDACRTIDDHFDRVRWQIHRIYRARNQLVHAGRMPSYLDSIVLNLADYYRSSIATIVSRARIDFEPSDIDQVVSEIRIRYEIHITRFKQARGPLTRDGLAILLDRV